MSGDICLEAMITQLNQSQLLDAIHAHVEEERENNAVTYNLTGPYQSYERIQLAGRRWSVEKRFEEYGFARLVAPNKDVLDIGSNMGFFVVEFALKCRSADGIEPNPHLIQIGKLTAEFVGVGGKVRFFDTKFEDFVADRQYDLILSLAAFFTADGREREDAEQYFGRISDLLRPGGRLFYESTSYHKTPGSSSFEHLAAADRAASSMASRFEFERDWEEQTGDQGGHRRFILAKLPNE